MLDAAEPHTVCPFSLRRVFLARSGKPTLKYEISACGALNFYCCYPIDWDPCSPLLYGIYGSLRIW